MGNPTINTTTFKSKSKILVIAIAIIAVFVLVLVGQIGKDAYSSSNNTPDFNLKTLDGKQSVFRVI